ncbi:hypothetical protein UFOVP919_16 [uncultured Caudovirales phage]|uniref:Uncharacterized protein n=1 Tax=uncultured Caudovirales phage TaxID=2100421 RepID=A0A6J5PJJ5_9CAUD|nr:hypothetical protein UFOVP832_9 [uncultured Caudovirales phage]CAB4171262.1 hypothetical protein UFOVP919_16 [uncultured Caudovirales phage]CAB4214080.1 hypothetical protein UFOVP1453_14 [uncultured Caudovirales phage]
MNLVVAGNRIPTMCSDAIARVAVLESVAREYPQESVTTHHVIHGGMYARTVSLKAGVMITGALIKTPTMLVINGDVTVFADNESFRLTGFHVIPASANRKQAFIAHADTAMTMIFVSDATTVAQAENEFTDEADSLMSRNEEANNFIIITGE